MARCNIFWDCTLFASKCGCIDLDLNNAMITYTLKDTNSIVGFVVKKRSRILESRVGRETV